ncbi:MAG: FG-GAP-like repeat-containing protein [Cucumibacter sp.]
MAAAFFVFSALAPVSVPAMEIDETLKADRPAVLDIQRRLNELGFDTGTPDGLWGGRSDRAATAFHDNWATDLPAVMDQTLAARIVRVHDSWFTPPQWIEQDIFDLPRRGAVVDVTAMLPDCEMPVCDVFMIYAAAGDVTGDGLADYITSTARTENGRNTRLPSAQVILENLGTGRAFQLLDIDLPMRVHGREAVFADFNGDGRPDLFIAAHGLDANPFPGEQSLLMLSTPEGGLADVSDANLPPLSAMNHGAAAHDMDGDGDNDILVITNYGSNTIDPYILVNDGQGVFSLSNGRDRITPSLLNLLGNGPDRAKYNTARFADLNGDGHDDLLLAISGDDARNATRFSGMRRTRLIHNDGTDHWLKENAIELPVTRWGYATHTTDIDVADVDNDGDPDLLLTEATLFGEGNWRAQYHQLLLGDGQGGYVDASATHLWNQGYPDMQELAFPMHSYLVDLDLDGDVDLVTQTRDPLYQDGGEGTWRMVLALNSGGGHFEPVNPRSLAAEPYVGRFIVPIDTDNDGDMDLVGLSLDGQNFGDEFFTRGLALDIFINTTLPR